MTEARRVLESKEASQQLGLAWQFKVDSCCSLVDDDTSGRPGDEVGGSPRTLGASSGLSDGQRNHSPTAGLVPGCVDNTFVDIMPSAGSKISQPREDAAMVDGPSRDGSPPEKKMSSRFSLPSRTMKGIGNFLKTGSRVSDDSAEQTVSEKQKGGRLSPWGGTAPRPRGSIFPDKEEMKKKVRERLRTGNTMSEELAFPMYKAHGLCQELVQSQTFELVMAFMVIANALWLMVDADYNDADILLQAAWPFQCAEHMFCISFSFEWAVRLLAFESKIRGFCSSSFLFDTALVVLMVFETWVVTGVALLGVWGNTGLPNVWVLRLLRLLRLTRISRIARIMRSLPELLCLLKGMVAATRGVACLLGLLVSLLYVFAIILRQLSESTEMAATYFSSVPHAMYTLVFAGAMLDNVGQVMSDVGRESIVCAMLLGVVVLLTAVTMMNMLIGVLCEVMGTVAAVEKEEITCSIVKREVAAALHICDTDNNGLISQQEFHQILENDVAVKALQNVGVDPATMIDFASTFFQNEDKPTNYDKSLDFDDFMDLVLRLRGENPASVRDCLDLKHFILNQNIAVHTSIARLEAWMSMQEAVSTPSHPQTKKEAARPAAETLT